MHLFSVKQAVFLYDLFSDIECSFCTLAIHQKFIQMPSEAFWFFVAF